MFMHVPVGGQAEVREVMSTAPVAWKNVLVLENISSIMTLQMKVSDMEIQLLDASRGQAAVTKDNILHVLLSSAPSHQLFGSARRRAQPPVSSCPLLPQDTGTETSIRLPPHKTSTPTHITTGLFLRSALTAHSSGSCSTLLSTRSRHISSPPRSTRPRTRRSAVCGMEAVGAT